MKRRGYPQRPLVRRLPDVAMLFLILTLTNVHSSQAPTKLLVLRHPMYIFVTDTLFLLGYEPPVHRLERRRVN